MLRPYLALEEERRQFCTLAQPETRAGYRRFRKACRAAEDAIDAIRDTLADERQRLFRNERYLSSLVDDPVVSNAYEIEGIDLVTRLNAVRADRQVNDEALAKANETEHDIQARYEEGVASYAALRKAKRKQPLAFAAGSLAGIVLATGITGAALIRHYESRPAPPPRVETRIETRYVDSAAPVPRNLEEHLEGVELRIGEPLVVIDPARQEERVYRVALVERMRHPVSTGRTPGAKMSGGDNRTPEVPPGEYFEVTMVEPSTTWKRHGRYAYGPWFARIDTPDRELAKWGLTYKGSSIGLHGTDEPDHLGTRRSEGCIRHDDEVIARMVGQGILERGTKVVIDTGVLGGS